VLVIFAFESRPFEFGRRELRVDTGGVLDGFGADTETEGGEGFELVVRGWRAVDDEGGSRVTTERFLEDTGKFGVTVGYMFDLAVIKSLKLDI
jgi:hypothetical protein